MAGPTVPPPDSRYTDPSGPALGLAPEGWTEIASYGVIGDARTAALVSPHGSIDWACFPRFHDPSFFGRILDRSRGGSHRILVLGGARAGYQRYLPSTNVLETCLLVDARRRLLITDFMPTSASADPSPPRVLRQLVAEGGPVGVRVEVDPRFDYGRAPPIRWREDGSGAAVATSGRWLARFGAPWRWEFDGPLARATGTVRPASPLATSILWGDADVANDVAQLLDQTTRFWRRWVHHPDAPLHRRAHVWHDWVERSELLLRLLTDTTTGAFVAAPTTSLPEWYGGPRNWDYRFVWIRDAAFAAQALLLLGHLTEGREYVRWVVSRLTGAGAGDPPLRTLYDVEGALPPVEETLDHWEGYRRSQPIRIGNAAVEQLQLDIFGEVMDAVSLLLPIDPGFVEEHWPHLAQLPDLVARIWSRKDSGIWESRTAPAHFVHSKMMCWVALDRGAHLADRVGEGSRARRWRRTAETVRAAVLRRGYRPKLGSFVQAFDRARPDASLLRLPMMGFLPFDHPKVVGTLRWVESRLANGPFLYRYEPARTLHGPEGTFLACGFWLVECLARSGEKGRAVRNFRRLLRASGPLKLFSEEYDPVSGQRLGNYPQAFTHIALLRAALAIGAEPAAGTWVDPSTALGAKAAPARSKKPK